MNEWQFWQKLGNLGWRVVEADWQFLRVYLALDSRAVFGLELQRWSDSGSDDGHAYFTEHRLTRSQPLSQAIRELLASY